MDNYTLFDIVSLGLIFFSALFAYFRGLIREIILITNWLLSILLAYLISPIIFSFISQLEFLKSIFSDSCELIMIVAFLSGFICSLIIISFFTHNLSKLIETSMFSELNKIFGLIFGLARGLLLIVIFLLVHNQIWKDGSGWSQVINSKTNSLTLILQTKTLGVYPKNIPNWLIKNYEALVTQCLIK